MSYSSKPGSVSTSASRWALWALLVVLPAPSSAQQPEGAEAAKPAGTPAPAEGAEPAEGEPAAAAPAEGAAPAGQAEATEEGGAVELSGANEAIYLEDWPRAARLAYLAMRKTKPSAEKYESAQFALAQALEQLQLRQASAEYYFAVAEQRQNPALLARSLQGLERLSRDGVLDEEKLLRGVLVEAELSNIPAKVGDFLHFYRGIANLRAGYRRWAKKDFAAVRPDTYYGRRVQLTEAVTLVREGKNDEALKLVDAFITARAKDQADEEAATAPAAPAPETSSEQAGVRVVPVGSEADARLIRARLLYEMGRYDDAIAEYKRLRRTKASPAGELLLERAWAHFRGGAYHDSMGLLYSLGAPSNRDLFLPDQYVLRGLIYQRFCHFRAAKAAVDDFRARYGAMVAELKSGKPAREVEIISAAALDRIEVRPFALISREVNQEKELADDLSSTLEEGGLSVHLVALYQLLEDRATWMLDRAMEAGARTVAEKLLEADEQANLLDYEVGVSIFRPIRDPSGKLRLRQEVEVVPRGGNRVYYPFDGEFWSDELPNMRFLIQDRCVE